MKKEIFRGCGVALITPFNESGVNFDKLGELIEFQIQNKTDALIVCGTTGEASTLPDEEHISVIRYTVNKTAGRVPVIAGTGSNYTAHGIELCTEAEKSGADALLTVTPYYNKATQKGLIAHYEALAQSVSIPMIVYNVPGRTSLNITPQTAYELSKIPNIVAIKEASGNISASAQIAALCGPDFSIYSGNDDMVVPILSLGGKGVISVAANIIPKQMHDMAALFLEGELAKSRELQLKYMELIDALFVEVNPIPIKTAMNLMGFDVGGLRLPLCDMDEKNLTILKNALKKYELIK